MKQFNILSPVADLPLFINEFDFWVYYIQLIEVNRPLLTMSEVRCLASLLIQEFDCLPKDKNCIDNVAKTLRINATPRNTYPGVYKLYSSLCDKGYLVKKDDGHYYINSVLNNFRKYIKANINKDDFDISFIFKFKIQKNVNPR